MLDGVDASDTIDTASQDKNLNICFDFSPAPTCRKWQQIFIIQNSTCTNRWAAEDIINDLEGFVMKFSLLESCL